MDMEEFLWATGREELADSIRTHFSEMSAMPEAAHQAAIQAYKQYLVVGGMPEVVSKYVSTGSEVVKIRSCYQSIPAQLAKDNLKFQYKVVQKGGTATIFGASLDWLKHAGLINKCELVSSAFIPLQAYVDPSDFKIYLKDVGLLTQMSGMPPQLLLSDIEVDNTFMGGMTESYVAQALSAAGHNLYYWRNENAGEIDFVIQQGEHVIPIEVKKARTVSFNKFRTEYHPAESVRFSKKNFGEVDDLKAIPLYAIFCLVKQ